MVMTFLIVKMKKILCVYFDNKLNCDYHIDKLCKKASQKLHDLASVGSHEL